MRALHVIILGSAFGLSLLHCGSRSQILGDDTVSSVSDAGDAPATFDATDAIPDAIDEGHIKLGDAIVEDDVQITAGEGHVCLRTHTGDIFCWGENTLGQLGDGTLISRATPKKVPGIPPALNVAAGTHHTCILGRDQSVWCWGGNTQGQLGQGTQGDPISTPAQVPGLSGPPGTLTNAPIGVVAGGYHTCSFDNAGVVKCWGWNVQGESGASNASFVLTPQVVNGLGFVTALAAGFEHTCAIEQAGNVKCWGADESGELGNDNIGGREILPVDAIGVKDAVSIACGEDHTCVVLKDGTMQCWGDGGSGELGQGRNQLSEVAVAVAGVTDARQAAGGKEHTCVATTSHQVKCFGDGRAGQLGNGTTPYVQATPADVSVQNVRSVAAGDDFTCVAHSDHGVSCWGGNLFGQLGTGVFSDGGATPLPVDVVGL
jgi:alpha-tubulin suppressor-like RCC1 family protein